MYELVRGPLVWIAFLVFFGGCIYKLREMYLLAVAEKSVLPVMNLKFGLRSLFHWLVPFNSKNMRMHPVMTIVTFSFHICLIITPLFAMGHVVMVHDSVGFSWGALPAGATDVMTSIVIAACIFFALRRIALPEVRNVTFLSDWFLLLVVVAPFVTGLLAHWQLLPYELMLTLHIACGALWLIVIPFTRLSHMLWFVFTRAFMGSDFGAVRNARDW